MPVGVNPWGFPDPPIPDEFGLVGVGADLEPATLVDAYRHGLFPMPIGDPGSDGDEAMATMGWWSPAERGVLMPDDLIVSRSLRRSCRRYTVTINAAFERVIANCASANRDGDWISPAIIKAYTRLHHLGWAHSVETWHDDQLVGGLYGVQIAGLFAGESMFHTATDASKVALVALVAGAEEVGITLIDTQWQTDHLATLGVRTLTLSRYLDQMRRAIASSALSLASRPDPKWVAQSGRFLYRSGVVPMEPKPPRTA